MVAVSYQILLHGAFLAQTMKSVSALTEARPIHQRAIDVAQQVVSDVSRSEARLINQQIINQPQKKKPFSVDMVRNGSLDFSHYYKMGIVAGASSDLIPDVHNYKGDFHQFMSHGVLEVRHWMSYINGAIAAAVSWSKMQAIF